MEIKHSEIEDTVLVCPYCMSVVTEDTPGHCSESSGHFELAVELVDGSPYLLSEIEITSEVQS